MRLPQHPDRHLFKTHPNKRSETTPQHFPATNTRSRNTPRQWHLPPRQPLHRPQRTLLNRNLTQHRSTTSTPTINSQAESASTTHSPCSRFNHHYITRRTPDLLFCLTCPSQSDRKSTFLCPFRRNHDRKLSGFPELPHQRTNEKKSKKILKK